MADDSDVETGSQSSMSDYKMLSPMDTFKETAKKLKRTMAVNSIGESAAVEILDEKENQTRYTIYVNVLVNYIGKIDLVEQTFVARFDVYLEWDISGKFGLPSVQKFKPVLRFPEAESWSRDIDDVEFTGPSFSSFRASITGTFRTALDLRNFPFDMQGLKVEIMLGVNSRGDNKGELLTIESGYSFAQNPEKPNLCDSQIDTEYNFRPLRYYLSASSKIMSQVSSRDGRKGTRSKFVVVIPIERDSSFWLLNNYVFVLLCQILSFSTFALEMPAQAGDVLGITLALYFLLVAYKFALMSGLPRLSYFTHFDLYLAMVFALLFMQYVLQTLLLWVKDSGESFTDDWNYLFYACMGTSFLAHVWIGLKGRFLYRNQTKNIQRLGTIDRTALQIFKRSGIEISKKNGMVKNIHRYRQLMKEIDGVKLS